MTKTATGTVYGLIDPRNGKLRYIGQTKQRPATRVRGKYAPRVVAWLAEMRGAGVRPSIVVLRENVPAAGLLASRRLPSSPRCLMSSAVNCVRTLSIPHPISTPTAAGMIAPSVGITDPTVAPFPWCASGIRARCGKMNGMDAVRSACSRAWGSRIDAQL